MLHASISGITAVITADGDITHTTRLFKNEIVTGTVITARGETQYVRFGDWVEWASLLVLAGAVVVALRRRRLTTAEPPPRGSDQ